MLHMTSNSEDYYVQRKSLQAPDIFELGLAWFEVRLEQQIKTYMFSHISK